MLSSLNVRVLLCFPWALCNAALGNKVTAVRGWSAAGQFEHWTSSTIQKEKGQYKWTWFMISWLIPFDTYLVEGDFYLIPAAFSELQLCAIAMAELTIDDFDCAKHVMFFKKCAKSLPEQYKTMDTNRCSPSDSGCWNSQQPALGDP